MTVTRNTYPWSCALGQLVRQASALVRGGGTRLPAGLDRTEQRLSYMRYKLIRENTSAFADMSRALQTQLLQQ